MNEIAVALAIDIEESFRGSICYFNRAPHVDVKKPSHIVIIHTSISGSFVVESLIKGDQSDAEKVASDVYTYISALKLRIDDKHVHRPIRWVEFSNRDEAPMSCSLPEYEGFAFTTHIKT